MARLNTSFSTTITFALNNNIALWEKQVTPPGFDGGGAVDTTTMRNTDWRTMNPKSLVSMTPMSFRAAYDADVLDDILDIINVKQIVKVTFPDSSYWLFWGWLNTFKPDRLSVDEAQPEAECEILIGNLDGNGNEAGPQYHGPTVSTTTMTTTTTT